MSRAAEWEALDAEWQAARRDVERKRKAVLSTAVEFTRAAIAGRYPDVIAEWREAFETADAEWDAAREAEFNAYKRRESFAASRAA